MRVRYYFITKGLGFRVWYGSIGSLRGSVFKFVIRVLAGESQSVETFPGFAWLLFRGFFTNYVCIFWHFLTSYVTSLLFLWSKLTHFLKRKLWLNSIIAAIFQVTRIEIVKLWKSKSEHYNFTKKPKKTCVSGELLTVICRYLN